MAKVDTINDLKARVSEGRGFANPTLYYVVLPSDNNRDISFFCKSVSLPSRSLLTVQREIGTDLRNVAYGYQNANVSMSFQVLNDQKVRQYFDDWQNSIVTRYTEQDGNHVVAYPDKYMRSIKIVQLEKGFSQAILGANRRIGIGPINVNIGGDLDLVTSARVVYQWELNYAYPVSFSQETLSNDAKGTVSEVNVEFTYRNWTGKSIEAGKREISIDASAEASTDIVNQATRGVYKTIDKILGRII